MVYDYNEEIKSNLFQFKGCYDIELRDYFLGRYYFWFRILYLGYYIVPIPSSKDSDNEREFNHVIEMFKGIKLPFLNVLFKSKNYKQSDQSYEERKNIKDILKIKDTTKVENKKILIVDDVYTTGNTIKVAVYLLSKCHPKKIKVLVMSKTMYK